MRNRFCLCNIQCCNNYLMVWSVWLQGICCCFYKCRGLWEEKNCGMHSSECVLAYSHLFYRAHCRHVPEWWPASQATEQTEHISLLWSGSKYHGNVSGRVITPSKVTKALILEQQTFSFVVTVRTDLYTCITIKLIYKKFGNIYIVSYIYFICMFIIIFLPCKKWLVDLT